MPTYSNTVPPMAIAAGDSYAVINNENPQPALPYKSAQVALATGFARDGAEDFGGSDICGCARGVQFSVADGGQRRGCQLFARGLGGDGTYGDKRGAH